MPGATDAPKRPLDGDDRTILSLLVEDARLSHREVSRRTGISLATVNRRIRRMEEEGTIRGAAAIVDAEAVGWGLTAIVGLRIEKGHLRAVQEAIAQDPRVMAVYDVTGDWDGLVITRLRDRADLDDLVKGTLSMPHIQRTHTMMVLKTVHEDALVRLPKM